MIQQTRSLRAAARVRNLSEEVYRRLRREIVQGVLRPNEALVEADLAERLRVSRTPIRESMQRLASDGLIVSRRRRWFVYEHSRDEVAELYEVRAALESYATRQAAVRATEAQLDAVVAFRERATASGVGEQDRVDVNARFHDLVIAAANNRRLALVIHRNRFYHFNYRVAALYSDHDLAVSASQHGQIVDALLARDAERAEAVAREHVEYAFALILRKLY